MKNSTSTLTDSVQALISSIKAVMTTLQQAKDCIRATRGDMFPRTSREGVAK